MVYEIKNGNCDNVSEYYDNGIIKFKGEYLKDSRNGKGKEYYYNGIIKFEGEYLKDSRNGKGKEYYNSSNYYYKFEKEYFIKFEGEYLKRKE